MEHILRVSERDNVTVRVIPFKAGSFPGAGQSVIYAEAAVRPLDTVELDSTHGPEFIDTEMQLTKYRAQLDAMESTTLAPGVSAHTGAKIRRWAKKNKAELCFTPANASWANPIEAHFGPLRQFTLANSHHPNHTVQTRELHRYLRWRNANARHPDVLATQRRERARIRSEKGIRWGGRPLTKAA